MAQTNPEIEKLKSDHIFDLLNSKEELRDWLYVYFDIKFPMGTVYPTSSHGPVDAMWRIYELFKTGGSKDVSSVAMLASRDSGKTLSAAAIEVLAMVHFRIPVAHMAAIRGQSEKSIQYVNSFFRKIKPYLEANKWVQSSDSKSMIEWITDEGDNVYLKVVVATIAGANCVSPTSMIRKADGSEDFAINIKPGDLLTTFNYWENEYKTVKVGSISFTDKQARRINFEEGNTIVCSDDHKIFTNRGWITADQLYLGDKCVSFRDQNSTIDNRFDLNVKSIDILGELPLMDVHIDTDNEHEKSFFAEGLLVHNSEHVPLLCVDGKTEIVCEKIISGKRGKKTAKGIYDSLKRGEEMKALTHNHETGEFQFKKVLAGFKSEKQSYKVTIGGVELICSEDHPIFIVGLNKGYTPLRDVKIGDTCLLISGKGLKSCEVEKIEVLDVRTLYDFTVEDNHNFFANGILVHNCIDEIDTIRDPRALEEAKMIPTVYKKYFPITVYLSTRKFAGGLMEKTVKQVEKSGGEILRWNIIDVTERITKAEAKADEPKVQRFISRDLPMVNLSPEEYNRLSEKQQNQYEEIWAYAGIALDKMLPVMKNYLVDRPQNDRGGLFKPLSAVHSNFKQLSDGMAGAQLLCEKPSSVGLVYPKFDNLLNTISIADAFEQISGRVNESMTFDMLINYMVNLGVQFYGGGDWGFTDHTCLVVLAVLPNGEVWLIDNICEPGLEIPDILKYAKMLQESYPIQKWYCDSAYPAYIKMFNTNGLRAPTIVKDVSAGISAVQRKIVSATNVRSFKVLRIDRNERVLEAFSTYKWKVDGKGDPTDKPDHGTDGTADVMDSIRYPFQILFGQKSGGVSMTAAGGEGSVTRTTPRNKDLEADTEELNRKIMMNKISELAVHKPQELMAPAKKRIVW